ncbi:MAG: restriction endonuclease subunit S, partial [Treponemataceae bacterium]|nr:restriction endonuclease subunit S [Treponemataceae bacterium]
MTEWKDCKLGDFANIIMGQSPESKYYNTNNEGLPFLQGNRTFGYKYPTFDTYTSFITKKAEMNDIIMSVRAPVGDLNIAPEELCLGRGVCSIRALNGEQMFLYYLMKAYRKHLINKENGTVFGSVNRND